MNPDQLDNSNTNTRFSLDACDSPCNDVFRTPRSLSHWREKVEESNGPAKPYIYTRQTASALGTLVSLTHRHHHLAFPANQHLFHAYPPTNRPIANDSTFDGTTGQNLKKLSLCPVVPRILFRDWKWCQRHNTSCRNNTQSEHVLHLITQSEHRGQSGHLHAKAQLAVSEEPPHRCQRTRRWAQRPHWTVSETPYHRTENLYDDPTPRIRHPSRSVRLPLVSPSPHHKYAPVNPTGMVDSANTTPHPCITLRAASPRPNLLGLG
jgi:hypothetical protein